MQAPVLEDRRGCVSDELAETVARRLAALAEPTRLKLALTLRARGDASVQELADAVDGSVANVSKHLQILRQSGILTRHKHGTYVRYQIASPQAAALLVYAVRILGNARRPR